MELYSGEGVIRRAGINMDQVEIELKTTIDPIWDYAGYHVPAANQKEYLAIALIALTSNRRVYCSISDGPAGPGPAPAPRIISKIGLVA